jgi:hypothetical protein
MTFEGNILKMRTELASPVNYFLPVGNNEITMNKLIGKTFKMHFTGQINCISCGKIIKTSYNQGFCYNCLQTAPEASESVVHPELSKAQFGIARDMKWAQEHDLIDHIVYLAVTSELKVGVTRHHQVPFRWIDQGASYAIKIAKTPNRHIAGILEIFLKKYFTDRTNWQAMLKNEIEKNVDLTKEKLKIFSLLPSELKKYYSDDDEITQIEYPVIKYPEKVKNFSFDTSHDLYGTLSGIKGQYLIFSDDTVVNIRKHNGYYLEVKV